MIPTYLFICFFLNTFSESTCFVFFFFEKFNLHWNLTYYFNSKFRMKLETLILIFITLRMTWIIINTHYTWICGSEYSIFVHVHARSRLHEGSKRRPTDRWVIILQKNGRTNVSVNPLGFACSLSHTTRRSRSHTYMRRLNTGDLVSQRPLLPASCTHSSRCMTVFS